MLMQRFDWLCVSLVLLGIALSFGGISLNGLVRIANGGSMPIIGEPDVLVNVDERQRHYVKEGDGKLLFLADCIRINFPEVRLPDKKSWAKLYEFAKLLDYPLEGGPNLVSIGDLMRWIGAVLLLLIIPLILLRIPFRLVRDGIRFVQKRRDRLP
jgi:hypothetical protein